MSNIVNRPGSVKINYVKHYKDDIFSDLTDRVLEINIHSDIDISSSFATIIIADYSNHMFNFGIANGHVIEFEVEYSQETIKRKYIIQSVDSIRNLENGRTYELKCVSPLRYVSNYAKVSKGYFDTTSNIAARIYSDFTNEKIFHWEPSISVQTLIIPNLSPIDAIQWLGKISESNTTTSNFHFFQDSRQRFYFMSLAKTKEIWSDDVITYRYNANTLMENGIPNTEAELTKILNLHYIKAFDIQKAIKDGLIHNTVYYTDFTHKTINVVQNSYWDSFSQDSLNRKTLFREEDFFPGKTHYVNTATHSTLLPNEGATEDPRTFGAQFNNMYHQQIEIIVHGNPFVEISQLVKIEIPSPEPVNEKEKFKMDDYWSGKYIVLAKRDRINGDGHQMVLRLGKDSLK